jgi:PEP-CTERM motif
MCLFDYRCFEEHVMKLARFAQLAFTALAVVVCVRASPLYVGQFNRVGEYDSLTGAAINDNFITDMGSPHGLALSGNTLFVPNYGANTVGEYNATTGAAINDNFISGLNGPTVIVIAPSVPEPSTWSLIAVGVALLGFMLRRKIPHHVGINVGAATARIARGVL